MITGGPASAPIEVMMAVTPEFVIGVAATLRSAGEHLAGDDRLVAHVVCPRDPVRLKLEQSLEGLRVEVRWHDPEKSLDRLPPALSGMSPISFQRVFSAELLETACGRFIYLDADLLVRRSLRDLWEHDLTGCVIGAAVDPYIPFVSARHGVADWDELGLDRALPYFNAGVLLFDQTQWRALDLTRRVVDHYTANAHRTRLFDQEALNVVLAGRWARLPVAWNAGMALFEGNFEGFAVLDRNEVDSARGDPAIVHFTGRNPWDPYCAGPWLAEWRDVIGRTPFAGSLGQPRTVFQRASSRIRKAARVLRYG